MNPEKDELPTLHQTERIYHGFLGMANNREDLVSSQTSWYNVKRFAMEAVICLLEATRVCRPWVPFWPHALQAHFKRGESWPISSAVKKA
jgi:hypothetical protein